MHSKRLGNLGELKVAASLVSLGYSVFKEFGDISKIDLVLEIEGILLGVQVKTIRKKANGTYVVYVCKSGPNYRFRYTENDCDIFAIYCVEDDCILWLLASEVTKSGSCITFRSDSTKNSQKLGIKYIKDYLDLTRVLRDYEQDIPKRKWG